MVQENETQALKSLTAVLCVQISYLSDSNVTIPHTIHFVIFDTLITRSILSKVSRKYKQSCPLGTSLVNYISNSILIRGF